MVGAVVAAGVLSVGTAEAQVTKFSTDVTTAIDSGIARLAQQLVYGDANAANGCSSNAGNSAGLAALALLEKRASADQNSVSQGYSGATAVDKARLDEVICFIIAQHKAAAHTPIVTAPI